MAPAAPGRPPHPALLTGRQAAPAPSSARRSQALHQPRDRTGLGRVVPTAPGPSPTTPSPPQPRSARGKRFGFLSSPRSAPRYPISAQPPSPASPGADQSTGAVRLCQSDRSRFGGGRGGKEREHPSGRPRPAPPHGPPTSQPPPAALPPVPLALTGAADAATSVSGARAVSGPAGGKREGGGGGAARARASAQRPRNKMAAAP